MNRHKTALTRGQERAGLRVIGVANVPPWRPGGAEFSTLLLLRRLEREFGHSCGMLGLDPAGGSRRFLGLPLRALRDVDELSRRVERERPDVIVSNQEGATLAAQIAGRLGVPRVHWFQSFEYAPPTNRERKLWRTSLDRVYPAETDRTIAASADVRLTNSAFLRDWYRRRLGMSSRICYPHFSEQVVLPRHHRGRGTYVTGICGWPYKGGDVFLDLAERFPHVPFLLVGSIAPEYLDRLRNVPNIRQGSWPTPRSLLALSRIVLVPSRWPEPFGRIAVEAMASGIPTLVSDTGGLPEVVGGSPGHLVRRFRSSGAWAGRLATLLSDERVFRDNAATGIRLAQRWLENDSARQLDSRLRELCAHGPRTRDRRPVLDIHGGSHQQTAFAMVNTRLREVLERRGRVRLVPDSDPGRTIVPDVTVHHDFTARFDSQPLAAAGHAVAMRTWDFGPYPAAWASAIVERYDELWVHSRWIREQAIRGGVPGRRVRVIPLGVDTAVFKPSGPSLRISTRKTTRFLFVGAPVLRKGIDVLLRAWRQAFTATDDVSLIVKANPKDVFYEGIDWRNEIRQQAAGGAEILLIDRLLPVSALAGLYRACEAAVFPYRAEGFGLPILEAMACGCTPIVPRFGACLDYCTARGAHFVRARRIQLPVNRRLAFNTLGFEEDVQSVDFCEVPVDALAETLVRVARMTKADRAAMVRRGVADAARFSWDASATAIERAVSRLAARSLPVRLRAARRGAERRARLEATARDLLEKSRANVIPIPP